MASRHPFRRIVLLIGAAVAAAGACSSGTDTSSPPSTPQPSTTAAAPSTTESGPVLPADLQSLIDATSLRDIDAAYADVPLPPADSHVAVVVEDVADIEAPARANATVSDYVNSLLRVDGTVAHFVTEFDTDGGVLECHILLGFGNCASPSTPDSWVEPFGYFGNIDREVFDVIYTVRNDAVLIDTVFEDGTRQRSEPPGGIVLVTTDGSDPATLTLYLADGHTDTFDLRPPPELDPEPLVEDE